MRFLYNIALLLLLPWALLHLALRARRQPEYLRHVPERFGFFNAAPDRPLIWVHAVSVGETRAAEPLVKVLKSRHPQHRFLLTHATPTGRQTGVELFGDDVLRCYLPYDFTWAVRRFVRHFRPEAGIFLETEIWPNLVDVCDKAGMPLFLVNARMSEKSARGYRRFASLTRRALETLSAIGAQTARDANLLAELGGGNITITGNIKFDREAPQQMLELGRRLRESFGNGRPVFLAASTRDGEEALILDALAASPIADLLTVIVPRHPQRFDEVAGLLARRGLPFQRRSENRSVEPGCQVLLGDSMGELFAYYAACDVACVGGSLLPLGGQNLLEACAVGTPVIVGPHTFNFTEVTEGAVTAGAVLRVADATELVRALGSLLRDSERREAMSRAGRAFTAAHRGATLRTLELLRW
jgi:3-deoxy-D-manno-octulosonic-acid transferase